VSDHHHHHDDDDMSEHERPLSGPALRAKSAGVAARREGPRRSQGARRADRHLRDEGRPAQRRPNRRARVGKSRLQEAPARGRHRRDRGVRLHRPPRRGHGSARKHAQGAQRRRVHAVLLLSVAGARAAARLVQVCAAVIARAVIDPRERLSASVADAAGARRCGSGSRTHDPLPRPARHFAPRTPSERARDRHVRARYGGRLVPDGRQPEHRPRIAGAQRAHDDVAHLARVFEHYHVLALAADEAELRDRGGGVLEQALLVGGICPRARDDSGAVARAGPSSRRCRSARRAPLGSTSPSRRAATPALLRAARGLRAGARARSYRRRHDGDDDRSRLFSSRC